MKLECCLNCGRLSDDLIPDLWPVFDSSKLVMDTYEVALCPDCSLALRKEPDYCLVKLKSNTVAICTFNYNGVSPEEIREAARS